MELGISFHVGSKKNAIKNLDKIKKIDEHNNRKYKNVNNKEIDPTLSRENMTLRGSKNITNDVKELYKKEFTEAVCKYNLKQEDERRKVVDYLEKMNKDEKNNIAVEFIYQVGDAETWKGRSLEDKKKTKEIFEKAIDILEAKGIKVANATIHYDETSPHMHVVGVPIVENQKRGLEKQVSQRKVLTREVLKELREETEKAFIEEYKRVYKTNDVTLKKGSEIEEHLSVEDYKNTKKMLEVAKKYGNKKELKETLENDLEKLKTDIEIIKENVEDKKKEKQEKIEVFENIKTETNELTNELESLKTTKQAKLKEKEDKELELDLYQQKIKEYKDQIEKDKKEAERLEEEQKKIEEDLKAQEKKNREIKDEIDKKNKEYNDHLTEKNTLEEKKKKLDEEKQKIEDFYKNMETIITAEKEKMIKDVEDAKIELTAEKKKLESENLEIINDNNELVKAIGIEKEKKVNNIKEKEKIEKENKEIENSITNLKNEKTNLEANKLEISAGVKSLLENQKNYSDTLLLDYKKIENKEVIKEVAENKYDIQFTMTGYFYEDSIYKEDYKSSLGYYKNGKLEKSFTEIETENLTYTVANAVYSVYHNSFNKVELKHNCETGKTFMNINYYEEENKISIDTIDFKPIKTDNFISLIKTKLTDFKNYIVEALEEKFNCRSNNKNIFSKENNQKNIDKKKEEIEY